MAENILANFSAYPNDYQTEQTILHIQQFWTPAMRKTLKQEFNNGNVVCTDKMQAIIQQI